MRYFIYLAYDGTNYHGWQIQPNGASVQETLMKALATFLRKDIEVVGAGRTDAGVHAKLMIAHFDFDAELDGKTFPEFIGKRVDKFSKIGYHITFSCNNSVGNISQR